MNCKFPRALPVFFFLFVWGLTTHGKYSADGDEAHYLMIAESLVADHDLDLANNYAQNDGRLFGHSGLEAGQHARMSRLGHLESVHDIGLPVLIAAPYAVAKRISALVSDELLRRFRMDHGLFAYSLVSLLLIGMTAVAGASLLKADMTHAASPSTAVLVVGAVLLAPPVLSHAFLIFPEGVAFAVTCVTLRMAFVDGRSDRPMWPFILLAAALGLLPWLHRKYSLFVMGLAALVAWKQSGLLRSVSRSTGVALVTAFALPFALLYLWTWSHWGNLAGPQMLDAQRVSLHTLDRGLAGLLMDRESGLLAYSPIYLLLPAAMFLYGSAVWPLLVPVALLYVPMAMFDEWWGGFSPAARYVMPLMPVAAIVLTRAAASRTFRRLFAMMLIPQAIICAAVWQHPRWLWPQGAGVNPALDHLGLPGRFYERLLPSIRASADPVLNAALVSWIALTVALVWWVRRERTSAAAPPDGPRDVGGHPGDRSVARARSAV